MSAINLKVLTLKGLPDYHSTANIYGNKRNRSNANNASNNTYNNFKYSRTLSTRS